MKRKTSIGFLFLLGGSLFFGGCASVVTPYNSTFDCSDRPGGKCVSAIEAYYAASGEEMPPEMSMVTPERAKAMLDGEKNTDENPAPAPAPPSRAKVAKVNHEEARTQYEEISFKKLTSYLKEPIAPVVTPAETMRVLFMPYKDENGSLNMARYTYVITEESKFAMGNDSTQMLLDDEDGEE